ncbi:MAG: PAS domain S-box protein [Leptolyngbyaceae cyanobacterium]
MSCDRPFLNQIPALLLAMDADGRLTAVSDRWLDWLGYERSQVIGRDWRDYLTAESRHRVQTASPQPWPLSTAEPVCLEFMTAEGASLLAQVATSSGEDTPRSAQTYLMSLTAIETSHAEHIAWQKQIELYEISFNAVPVGIMQTDLTHRLSWVNQCFCDMLGYTAAELLQLSIEDITHPEDIEKHRPEPISSATFQPEPSAVSLEIRYRRKDGSILWAKTTILQSHDEAQVPQPAIAIVEDLSDRKTAQAVQAQLEETLSLITETIEDHFWIDDAQHSIPIYDSPNIEKIWGVPEPVLTANLENQLERVHPDDREKIIAFRRRQSTQTQPGHYSFRIYHPNGEMRWLRERSFPLLDAEGRPEKTVGVTSDITEQKQLLEALSQSEERFRLLTENLQDVFWLRDLLTGENLYVSPAFETVWQLSRSELQVNPMAFLERIHPDDRHHVTTYIEARLAARESIQIDYRLLLPDGTVRWLRDRGFLIFDDDGAPIKMAGIASDITSSKEAEVSLRQSEERFRLLAENLEDVVWLHDQHTATFSYLNSAVETVWQVSRSALLENPLLIQERIHPEDRDRVTGYMTAQMAARESFRIDYRLLRPDGTVRWVSDRGFPIMDDTGNAINMGGIITDITASKTTEAALQRYERLVAANPDPVCLIGKDYTYQLTNPAFRAWCNDGVPLVGRHVADYFGEAFFEEISQPRIDQALAGNTQCFEEWAYNPELDAPQFISITYAPYYDADGRISGVSNSIRDLTTLKRTRDRLNQTAERLQMHMQNSPLAVIEWDHTLTVQNWSNQAVTFFGWSAEAMLGRHISNLPIFATETQADIRAYIHDLLHGETQRQTILTCNLTHNNERIYCEWYNSVLLDSHGQIQSILSVVQDVTERRQTQLALQISEERWQLAISGSNEGIWDWHIPSDQVFYSPRWKALLGYADEELPNTRRVWSQLVHPDDLGHVRTAMTAHLRRECETYQAEYRMRHKSGDYIWILARGQAVFDASGAPIRFVGSHADISDRKQAELDLQASQRLLQLVFNHMPQRVFWKGLDGRFLGCNQAFAADMGQSAPAAVVGKTDTELGVFHPELLQKFAARDREVIAAGQSLTFDEQENRYEDGRVRWISTIKSPFKTPQGELLGIFCCYEDVTDRVLAQRSLQRYARMVAAASDGICLLDTEYRYQVINQTYQDWYGHGDQPILGQTVAEVLGHATFENRLRPLHERCLAGETIRYERWFEFPHLGKRFRNVTMTPYREASGEITGVLTSIRDLTALKESETQQQQLFEVIDATPDLIGMALPDGRTVYTNPAFDRLLSARARSLSHIQHYHPQWAAEKIIQEAIPYAIAHGTWQGETALATEDGKEIPLSQTIIAHRNDQQVLKLLSTIARDIRPQKALEQELRDRLRFEQLLSRLSTEFVNLPCDRLHSSIAQALVEIAQLTKVQRSYLYLFSSDGERSHLYSQWHSDDLEPIPPQLQDVPSSSFEWFMTQLGEQHIIAINALDDVPSEAAMLRAAMDNMGTQALAVIAMRHSQKLIGVIGFSLTQPKCWTDDELMLLQLVGDLFTSAYQRQQIDAALRRQEHYYRQLTENASDLVVLLNEHGQLQYITPSVTRLLGYQPDALKHRAVREFVAPEDYLSLLQVRQAAIAQPGKPQPLVQCRVRHEQGEWRYFEAIATSLLEDEGVKGIVVNCRDVSDRVAAEIAQRHSEEVFQAIFEQAAISMAQISLDGFYLKVNPAFCQLVGFTAAELIGEHYAKVTHPDDLAFDVDLTNAVAQGDVPAQVINKRFLCADRSVRHVQVVVTAVLGEEGKPAFLASVYNDLTEQIMAERSLRSIAEGTAAVTGEAFFPVLARQLAETIGVEHLFIYQLNDNQALDTLVYYGRLANAAELSPHTAGTPCELTLQQGFYCCPEHVQEQFPNDADLAWLNADSYVGVALMTSAGEVIGEICAIHSQPIQNLDNAITLLRIFGARASAELERQQSTAALQASEANWHNILNNMPVLLDAINQEGIVTLWNQECERVTGYSAAEIVGNPQAFDWLYPQAEQQRALRKAWGDHESNYRNWEWPITCKDGSQRMIAWSNISSEFPIPDLGSWGIGVDVTERRRAEDALRQSETRFQSLAANMPGIICRYHQTPDGSSYFSYVSPGSRTLWELEPETVYADASQAWALVHPDDLREFRQSMKASRRSGRPWFYEYRIHTPSGAEKWVQGVAKSELQPDGSYVWDGLLIDVTARKRAEIDLIASEARFQRLVSNTPGIIYRYHLDQQNLMNSYESGYFSYISPACRELWDLEPAAILADAATVWALFESSDREALQAAFLHSIHHLVPLSGEYQITTASGTLKWFRFIARPVQESQQRYLWDGVVIDVTEQIIAQQALQQSEALNQAIIDALPDMLVRMDIDGICLNAHFPSSFPTLFRGPIVGRHLRDILPPDLVERRIAGARQAIATQQTQVCEYQVSVQASTWWEESRIVPLTDREVLVLIRDVDERRRAEEEVRRLNHILESQNQRLEELVELRTAELVTFMNTLPDQIFVVDRDRHLLTFGNQAAIDFAGLASRHDFEGKTVHDCFSEERAAYYVQQNQQVFTTGDVLHVEEKIPKGTGHVYLDTYKIPLKRPDGQVYALIGTSRDITELVEIRQALEAQTTQLAATNLELESFSYSVSHDLRAPLRHINGFISALRQRLIATAQPPEAKVIHYLDVIENSSQRMGSLIDGLLTLSRVGRREMSLRPVPLNPLVDQAIALVCELPENAHHQLQIEIEQLPTVQGDAALLQQVFSNLVGNAVKFSRDRAPASLHIGQQGENTFFVRDNGVGFDMAYADKLFSPFQRLHKQEEFQGTGIGLAIVSRIVHRHGGQIWADSAINRGTTVYFTLPLAAPSPRLATP